MGVDYTARKAAKKARKAEGRTSVGKRTSALADRDAGVSGGGGATDKKGKRDRPKHGRKGARRMCKGMCYGAAPMVRDGERDREREKGSARGGETETHFRRRLATGGSAPDLLSISSSIISLSLISLSSTTTTWSGRRTTTSPPRSRCQSRR